jgi:hypothetical protein
MVRHRAVETVAACALHPANPDRQQVPQHRWTLLVLLLSRLSRPLMAFSRQAGPSPELARRRRPLTAVGLALDR